MFPADHMILKNLNNAETVFLAHLEVQNEQKFLTRAAPLRAFRPWFSHASLLEILSGQYSA